ncbi:MAG: RNA polymerase sigma factor [Planctomycetota bacterium]
MRKATPSAERSETPYFPEDLTLVRRSLARDESALEGLIERLKCVPRILAAINEKIGGHLSRDELADLSQDALVAVWRKLDTFEGRGRLETWVYGFCFRELMSFLRGKHRRRDALASRLELEEQLAVHPLLTLSLEVEEVERQLDHIGRPDSEVIRMKHYRDLTFREIGQRLRLSPNTAKAFYYRGLDKLRRRMRRLQPEDPR